MKGHTARYWFAENIQAFNDWVMAREQILTKNPLQMAHDKAQMEAQLRAGPEGERKATFGDGQQDYMMQRYKNLALIQISGSLVKTDNYWNRYYGLVSYDEIRRSVLLALQDPAVDGILAIMSTPGGSAAGADAMASFFSKANKVKPFYSFAETDMCSGGYYLAAPSREIYGQRAALVGSIGVIMVHMDVLDMYKEIGITPTVFRAGEFKALGTPYEHLDKKSKANIQSTLDSYFTMFNEHVVLHRGFDDVPSMLAEAGEGRVFMAEEAKEVGLVDQVAELEDTLEDVSAKARKGAGKVSQFSVSTQTRGSAMSHTKAKAAAAAGDDLTPEQIAALAAGADLANVGGAAAPAQEATGEGADLKKDEPEDKPAVTEEGAPKPEVTEAQPEALADAGSLDKIISLSSELGQTKASLKALEEKNVSLQKTLDEQTTTMSQLRDIVAQAINHRQVALGYQPSDVKALNEGQCIELFAQLDADFKTRFKPGQKSKPTQAAVETATLSPVADTARSMTGKL